MPYGVKGDYGIKGSGGGGATVVLPVRVVAADPLPSSYRDIEWDPPAGKTITAYRVYYTEPGGERTLYGTYAGNVESVRVGGLSPDTTDILFEVEGDYVVTATGSARGGTGAPSRALRSMAYISPYGAHLDTKTNAAITSTAMLFATPPFPPTTNSQTVRLWMFSVNGTPLTPLGIWFAAVNGGSQNNPTLNGGKPTWVAATSVVAPPIGSDAAPGLGPVCAYANVATTATVRGIAVRVLLPSGTYTRMNASGPIADYPVGVSVPSTQGDISANPGTTSGWGEAFGQIPSMILEYGDLSTPVVLLGVAGDSHTRGYVHITGARGPWDYMRSLWLAGTHPNVCLLNLGHAGHNQSQISTRMRTFESVLDVGGWIRQVMSVNDKSGGFDFTTAIVDASLATLSSDVSYLSGRDKPVILWQGPGMAGLAAGAYGRYIAPYSDGRLDAYTVMRCVDGIVTDVAANGVYIAGMSDDSGGHPGRVGQAAIAADMAPKLAPALATVGVPI